MKPIFIINIIIHKELTTLCTSPCPTIRIKSILIIQNSSSVRTKVFVHLFHHLSLKILILYFFLKFPFLKRIAPPIETTADPIPTAQLHALFKQSGQIPSLLFPTIILLQNLHFFSFIFSIIIPPLKQDIPDDLPP